MSITRRNVIASATAAAAVAAVPVTVQANDARLEALYAEWREAWGILIKANEIADNTQIDALCSCGQNPVEGDYASKADLEAAWNAWGAARHAAVERSGSIELKRKADVASAAESAALHRFIEAPSQTALLVLTFCPAFRPSPIFLASSLRLAAYSGATIG